MVNNQRPNAPSFRDNNIMTDSIRNNINAMKELDVNVGVGKLDREATRNKFVRTGGEQTKDIIAKQGVQRIDQQEQEGQRNIQNALAVASQRGIQSDSMGIIDPTVSNALAQIEATKLNEADAPDNFQRQYQLRLDQENSRRNIQGANREFNKRLKDISQRLQKRRGDIDYKLSETIRNRRVAQQKELNNFSRDVSAKLTGSNLAGSIIGGAIGALGYISGNAVLGGATTALGQQVGGMIGSGVGESQSLSMINSRRRRI